MSTTAALTPTQAAAARLVALAFPNGYRLPVPRPRSDAQADYDTYRQEMELGGGPLL